MICAWCWDQWSIKIHTCKHKQNPPSQTTTHWKERSKHSNHILSIGFNKQQESQHLSALSPIYYKEIRFSLQPSLSLVLPTWALIPFMAICKQPCLRFCLLVYFSKHIVDLWWVLLLLLICSDKQQLLKRKKINGIQTKSTNSTTLKQPMGPCWSGCVV